MARSCTICVFAKPPRAGMVKTRLASSIGAEAAATLASAFLVDTWQMVAGLKWAQPVLAATEESGFPWLPRNVPRWLQGDGDLGARIERVLCRALERGCPALAIGADTPGLPVPLMVDARFELERADAVLGPATDGGFYVIGMRDCPPGALAGLPWSDGQTFAATLARLRALRLRVTVLEPWFDVDRIEDLARLRALIRFGGLKAPETTKALAEIGLFRSASGHDSCA